MIITCSQCQTRFRVDDALIKETGTRVRCSNCQSVFTVFLPRSAGAQERPQAPIPRPPAPGQHASGPPGGASIPQAPVPRAPEAPEASEAPVRRLAARPLPPAARDFYIPSDLDGDSPPAPSGTGYGSDPGASREYAPPYDEGLLARHELSEQAPRPPAAPPAASRPPTAPEPRPPAFAGQAMPAPPAPAPAPQPADDFRADLAESQGPPAGYQDPGLGGDPLACGPVADPLGADPLASDPFAYQMPDGNQPGLGEPSRGAAFFGDAAPPEPPAPKPRLLEPRDRRPKDRRRLALAAAVAAALLTAGLYFYFSLDSGPEPGQAVQSPAADLRASANAGAAASQEGAQDAGLSGSATQGASPQLDTASLTQPDVPNSTEHLNFSKDLTTHHYRSNSEAGNILIVTGRVENRFPDRRSYIKVKAVLKNSQGTVVAERDAFAGNYLTENELTTLPMSEILARLALRGGQNSSNINIAPGSSVPFMLVFDKLPPDLAEYVVECVSSTPAGNVADSGRLETSRALT
ncbi:MAG: zinc-ribbon domain-containing protein [Deltaproteobacteria bacterium]|nr:zinc-ribbon domain-containing protein [Deltaproteobacteria bacterium]